MDTTYEQLEELRNYADLEGGELGAYWYELTDIYNRYVNYMSEGMRIASEKEINGILDYIHNKMEIVEKEEEVHYTRKLILLQDKSV